MAKGINKIILIGNLGGDPTTRSFPDGSQVTNVSLATESPGLISKQVRSKNVPSGIALHLMAAWQK